MGAVIVTVCAAVRCPAAVAYTWYVPAGTATGGVDHLPEASACTSVFAPPTDTNTEPPELAVPDTIGRRRPPPASIPLMLGLTARGEVGTGSEVGADDAFPCGRSGLPATGGSEVGEAAGAGLSVALFVGGDVGRPDDEGEGEG